MRIGVVYDDVAARSSATADERGVLESVDAVLAALEQLGHAPVPVPVGPSLGEWAGRLAAESVELVFNLCEGVCGRSAHEPRVAAVIELMGLPMTGSPAEALALARRKDRVNGLLVAGGVPVPGWTLVRSGEPCVAWGRFPAIVKPAGEDASVGITQQSVARNVDELTAALEASTIYGPLLVQEFYGGRELAVAFVGDRLLPISEIEFSVPAGAWPVVTYNAKWDAGSAEDLATSPRCPADLDSATRRRAESLARAAWDVVEGRGYGRVDLRGDDAGRLAVLDVNPNPDLAPSAGLARMAAAEGWDYTDLIGAIVREAVA